MKTVKIICVVAILAIGHATISHAIRETKIVASEGKTGDNFGVSVAIDGDFAIVGAPARWTSLPNSAMFDKTDNSAAGTAYIFQRNSKQWIQQQKLTATVPSDGRLGNLFGRSVSISGNIAIVGASTEASTGVVYVFMHAENAWVKQQKLTASDRRPGAYFGNSVAIDGDTVIIGAYGNETAYIFSRNGDNYWVEQAKLTPSDAGAGDWFGFNVAISGNTAIVSDSYDQKKGKDPINAGSAYIFVRSGGHWTEQAKLTASDGAGEDRFGYSVAIDEDTVIIGAILNENASGGGAAYLFERDGTNWTEHSKFIASGVSNGGHHFGVSVAISGDTVIVGAHGNNGNAGAGYVFMRDRESWTKPLKLVARDFQPGDEFGISVASTSDVLIVGARFDDDTGVDSGSAYIYNMPPKVDTATGGIGNQSLSGQTVDAIGPQITITQPSVTRGFEIVRNEKQIPVRGQTTDPSGIHEVIVNGVKANVAVDGRFWATIRLAYGDNLISVTATDARYNSTTKTFRVVRRQPTEPNFPSLVGKYYALIIAVKDYTHPSVNDLLFPIQDGERLIDVLTTDYTFEPENIRFLKNPDRKAILKTFQSLKAELTPFDNLLIFYSGHGWWDNDLTQGYWLPRDAERDDISGWLSNSTIRDYVRGIKNRHTLLISDACFSGGIFKVRSAFTQPKPSIEKIYEMLSRKAITSGALKTVPDRSVFLKYLVNNLEQNEAKYMYSEKLYIDMKPAVINNSPLNQTPLYGTIHGAGDEGGDFIFIRR